VENLTGSKQVKYPLIEPVTQEHQRPFWSVMIPAYNGTKYLEQTLKSVLVQDPGPDEMQIEVVDDCSTKDDPEELVQDIGKGRISFFRNPQNVGLLSNWDTCIRRAHGHWVHILHQDDLVLSGFYEQLRAGIQKESSVGAAFCRHSYINEKNECLFLSLPERETPGILTDWLQLIATMQRVQFPSIVVKRNTYEGLGGFCTEARSAADWEMWKRIAAHYPIWYEPQILASFRLHSSSESSRLIRTGANIADTRKAIEISRLYLPHTISQKVTTQAKEYYAIDAIKRANTLINQDDFEAAIAQIKEGLKCSYSFKVIFFLIYYKVIFFLIYYFVLWVLHSVKKKIKNS